MREIKFRLTWREISSGRILQTFVTLEQLLDHNEFTELTATRLIHNPDFELIARDQFIDKIDENSQDIYENDNVSYLCKSGIHRAYKSESTVIWKDSWFCLSNGAYIANKGERYIDGDEQPYEYYNFIKL